MVKRIQVCIWALLLLFMQVAGATNLTLWHVHEHQRTFIHQLVTEFNRQTQQQLQARYIELDDLQLSLIKGVIDNAAPDIIFIPSDKTGITEFKLSAIPENWFVAPIAAESYDTVRIAGQLYGAPILGGNHLMMFYNKAYIQSPARTWAEMQKQQQNLQRQGIKTIGWNYGEMYWLVGFIGAYGGWPVTAEHISLDTPAVQQALTFYRQLATDGLVPADCDYDCSTKRFYSGEFAYTLNGDWAFHEAKQQLGDKFGVALIPSIDGRKVTPMFSTMALAFPNHSLEGPHRAVLKQFIQYMQSESVQQQWLEQGRYPVHQAVVKHLSQSADPNVQMLIRQLKQSKAMPPHSSMTDAWLSLAKWFRLFSTGNITAAQATQMMQSYAEQQQAKRHEH